MKIPISFVEKGLVVKGHGENYIFYRNGTYEYDTFIDSAKPNKNLRGKIMTWKEYIINYPYYIWSSTYRRKLKYNGGDRF